MAQRRRRAMTSNDHRADHAARPRVRPHETPRARAAAPRAASFRGSPRRCSAPSSRGKSERGGARRATTTRTIAARTTWSVISRLTCTSCQIRYGLSVATTRDEERERAGRRSRPIEVDEDGSRGSEARSAPARRPPMSGRDPVERNQEKAVQRLGDADGMARRRSRTFPIATKVCAKSSLFSVYAVRIEPRSSASTASRGSTAAAMTTTTALACFGCEDAHRGGARKLRGRLVSRRATARRRGLGGLRAPARAAARGLRRHAAAPAAPGRRRGHAALARACPACRRVGAARPPHALGRADAGAAARRRRRGRDRARRDGVAARARTSRPRCFCGGGWYLDEPVAEALAAFGYVDCSATTFRQSLPRPTTRRACSCRAAPGARSPVGRVAARAAGDAFARHARPRPRPASRGLVHLHFHDWELVDRRRSLALAGVPEAAAAAEASAHGRRARRLAPSDAPDIDWHEATIAP